MEEVNLQSDLENGSAAGESFGGATQTTLDTVDYDNDNDEEHFHDQLPSVEEYKTNMTGAAGPSSPLKLAEGEASPGGDEDDDAAIHDQLPTVEEYKASTGTVAQSADSGSSCKRKCFCTFFTILFVGLVASAIVIPIALTRDGEGSRVRLFSRRRKVVAYLADESISDKELLNTPGTPQYEAALWIADHDPLQMDLPGKDQPHYRFIERYVMALFFHATGGSGWRYNPNFLTGADVCDWNGVTLSANTGNPVFMGVTGCKELKTDDGASYRYVRDVFLFANRMAGTIPDEIGYLQRLEILSLFSNPGLTGELVNGMLDLVNLQDLELHYCAISGTIPPNIGKMQALTNLGLSNNLLVGSIPDSFFDLTSLQWLFLDDNILDANIEQFAKLSSLFGLYAEDAGLFGSLTGEMIDGWSNMYELDLSTNLLSGALPENIFDHPLMEIIDLHENEIGGSLPVVSTTNSNLMFLSLYSNQLTGTIPPSIGNMDSIVHFDVGLNQLVLPFPSEMGQLTTLRYLFTNNNNFADHDIPGFVQKLTSLRELSMKDNNLTGEIPASIANLRRLILLDLDRNKLNGSIPEEVSLLSNLAFLFLNRNQLTGTLPTAMTTMYSLSAVLLDGNNLSGNADVVCNDPLIELGYFSSDCLGPDEEFECSCCTVCCHDTNTTCNNFAWTLNLDAIWEYGHSRVRYTVDWDLLPEDNP
eukprot:CAMPEP_0116998386 /NCGR_PEP_ID=MMETSP0472-20121206/1476_1 /TAXON_ID=693140 ORGANISM="Tiarina fusus, Strain LIS" /NCGR_SAMPLE_ID=MMETSP0472 /ASSEMBLY_ACC=CAM_ASM_000603 /LENGTH=700 /DNA_ID=CAMNT_0004697523 /DNA_START=165 /DNA_END=2267 /DNA_ORIENTATION=-